METFVNNVFLFFIDDGKKLLEGNEEAIIRLEIFNEKSSAEFTAELLERQCLAAAKRLGRREIIQML